MHRRCRLCPMTATTMSNRVWSVATVASVVVVQLVLGAVAIAIELLDAHFRQTDVVEKLRMTVLTASGIVLVIALIVGAVLFSRSSATVRGVGLSVAGSGVVVSIVGALYVFWVY
jgi:hypothetical protein